MERRGIRSVKLAMLVSIVVLTAVLPQVAIADDSTPTVASVVIVEGKIRRPARAAALLTTLTVECY